MMFAPGQRMKCIQTGDVRDEFVGREGFVARAGGCGFCPKYRIPCDIGVLFDGDTHSFCGTKDNFVPLCDPREFEITVEKEIA